MEFREHTLDNGLAVVAECNPRAYSTAVGMFVNTGSRDETDKVCGVSHFLEHMAFKGTPTRSADDVNREFDEMGAHYNASTSEEVTTYYAAVLPEYQSAAVELLADILRPSLRQQDFDTEKNVIIEEIRMYDDQPPFGAYEKLMAAHFGTHPLSRSILGTVDSITALTAGQMRDYFDRRYGPRTVSLVGTGRIDFDALVQSARRLCGGWQPHAADRETPRAPPHEGFECLLRETATQQYVVQLADGPAATDEDRYAYKLLMVILGDDSGSRLYWELVDPGLAEHASLSHHPFSGTGAALCYMSCEPEQTAGNLQRMRDLFRQVERHGVTGDELAQALSKVQSRLVLRSERPSGRLHRVGANWVQGLGYRSIRDELEAFRAVTLADIRATLEKYPLSVNTTISIGPLADVARPS